MAWATFSASMTGPFRGNGCTQQAVSILSTELVIYFVDGESLIYSAKIELPLRKG